MPAYDHITDAESWKAIEGHEVYQASTLGRVKSFKRNPLGVILKPTLRNNSYFFVVLYGGGYGKNGRSVLLHRLILETFVGPCPDGLECRHLDGNPGNNRLGNLAWGTRAENQNDRRSHGTHGMGERSPTSKLTETEVISIRSGWATGETQVDLAKKHGVTQANISAICHRITWTHI